MIELEGNVVAIYKTEHATIRIRDSAYIGKTEEELEQVRAEARRIACDIVIRAAERGIKV